MRVTATANRIEKKSNEESDASGTASFGIQLKCPRCGGDVPDQVCIGCDLHIRTIQGVVHALPPERVAYHARFVEVYERMCCEQFSGRPRDEYYLGLPYGIACSRSCPEWSWRARSFDYLLRRVLNPAVPRNARILDIGAGNCWLSYRLALAGYNPCAIDLMTNDQHGLGAAERYRNYVPEFFPRIRAEMANLPFRDGQFHAAIFNASLHHAENVEVALREALRCCMPNGIIIISDTPIYRSAEIGEHTAIQPLPPFLTGEAIKSLESRLMIRWAVHTPQLGLKRTLRRMNAWLWNHPRPPQFPIYVARKLP